MSSIKYTSEMRDIALKTKPMESFASSLYHKHYAYELLIKEEWELDCVLWYVDDGYVSPFGHHNIVDTEEYVDSFIEDDDTTTISNYIITHKKEIIDNLNKFASLLKSCMNEQIKK